MSQMLKSSGAMAAATLASRLLGMVREVVYAGFMGDTQVAGAFKLAFKIPNLFRRLLGEGALTAAFIPIFKEKEKNAGDAEMWRAANAVISGLLVVSGVLVLLVLGGVSVVVRFAPGFQPQTVLMLELLRWTFPYVLLACLAAVFIGILNARGHFLVPALGAVMLNVVMIASVLLLAPRFGHELSRQIFGLAVGVLVAGAVQAFFQFPLLRREGFRFHWESPWRNDSVKQVVGKMLPASVGVAAFQLNVLLTDCVAFFVDPQIIASFDYAVRLMELPQGVFGISLATYLLPTLAGLAVEKKFADFRTTLEKGVEHLLFVNLLAAVLLVVLAEPIIRLLFEHGRFDLYSTHRSGLALAFLAPSLVAYSIVNVLARAFFALGDTRTPMRVSVVCLVMNLLFAVSLVFSFKQAGLGLANSVTSYLQLGLLLYALRKKLPNTKFSEAWSQLPRLLGATALAGTIAYALLLVWDVHLGNGSVWLRLGEVFVPMTAAAAAYWAVAWWTHVPSAREMTALFLARLRGR